MCVFVYVYIYIYIFGIYSEVRVMGLWRLGTVPCQLDKGLGVYSRRVLQERKSRTDWTDYSDVYITDACWALGLWVLRLSETSGS